jgi:pimeloyl-ACP methyl ester carboxylesterase
VGVTYGSPSATKGRTALRIAAPEAKPGVKMPMVLALHGAGGSENMWFNAYRRRKDRRTLSDAGWVLVSPGMSGVGDLSKVIDTVAERWPVDRDRILIVGHSMGAASGQAFVKSRPKVAPRIRGARRRFAREGRGTA